jgi:hypothetical protein
LVSSISKQASTTFLSLYFVTFILVNTLKLYLHPQKQTSYLQGSIYIVPVFQPAHSVLHLRAAWKSLSTQIMSTKSGATQLVSLFEEGIGLEDAHLGIVTRLGVLYAKHVTLNFFPEEK